MKVVKVVKVMNLFEDQEIAVEMNFQVIVVLEEVLDSVWVAEVTMQGEVMMLVEVN